MKGEAPASEQTSLSGVFPTMINHRQRALLDGASGVLNALAAKRR
ncbi:hypothetical protein [Rhodobacter sp. 24-YEA-8]|nr:hypothetical protein [Rhodobacter sp. 24-YEA-8]